MNCVWNVWQAGACSKTCGGGTRKDTRTKKTVEKHGGTCRGKASFEEKCNTEKCPSKKAHIYSHHFNV